MPCNAVRIMTVEFSGSTDLPSLKAALEDLGFAVDLQGDRLSFYHKQSYSQGYGSFIDNRLQVPEGFDVNAVKRAYSAQIILKAAARNKWSVTQPVKGRKLLVQRN